MKFYPSLLPMKFYPSLLFFALASACSQHQQQQQLLSDPCGMGTAPLSTLSVVSRGMGPLTNEELGYTPAELSAPHGITLDRAGNLYVADQLRARIRKLVPTTNTASSLVEVMPTGAFYPMGVVTDGSNLYVSDIYKHTIRKVVLATGVMTTLAGSEGVFGTDDGVGAAARFYYPEGLALDGAGNLYVADGRSKAIRKIDLATQTVSTLSIPTNPFKRPAGLALDGAGNLYVSDMDLNTIYKLALATGAVSTVAGSGVVNQYGNVDGIGAAARLTAPYGMMLDGAGNLYVADTGNSTIRKIVLTTATVSTVAGAGGFPGNVDGIGDAARFDKPLGLVLDGAGNLYVTEVESGDVRKVVLATREVSTVASTKKQPLKRLYTPTQIAVDSACNLYVTSGVSGLQKVVPSTGDVTTLTRMGLAATTGLAVDSAGNLYATGASSLWVNKFSPATGLITAVPGTERTLPGEWNGSNGGPHPWGVVVDSDDTLYAANPDVGVIHKVELATGAASKLPIATGPVVALDGAGNLYTAKNYAILKIELASGKVSTLAGVAGSPGSVDGIGAAARFNAPSGLAVDGAGNLFLTDAENHVVRKLIIATGEVSTLVGVSGRSGLMPGSLPALLNQPIGIAAVPSGQLFIADKIEHAVLLVR